MSVKEIYEHNEWHNQYETLRAEQRAEIRRWQMGRRSASSDETSDSNARLDAQRAQQQESTKQIRDRRERAETKRRIEQWKQRKIDQKLAEEQERERMIKEIREKDNSKALSEVLRKEAVAEWKTKRRMDSHKMLMQKEIEHMQSIHKSIEANRTLSDFRSQDQKYIARRREASLQRYRSVVGNGAPQYSHRASCMPVLRDPQRLLRPTESSARRGTRDSEPAQAEERRIKEHAKSLSVRNIPKLGMPAWRKEARNA